MAATQAAHHAAHSHRKVYMQIFAALAILTLAEIAVTYFPAEKWIIGGALVGMALGKAVLVAAYFMHLRFENTTLALIASIPLFLCVFLAFALMPDHSYVDHKTTIEAPAEAESGH